MPLADIPEVDRACREDVLLFLTTRYDQASRVLREAQWEAFRAFVNLWLEVFDWRTEAGIERYLALGEEQRSARYDRFVRQAESWEVTLDHPVAEPPTQEDEERARWHREYERARDRAAKAAASAAANWESVRELLDAENRLRAMPDHLRGAFALLGLPPQATLGDARKRYRSLARRLHPDVSGDTKAMAEVNDAWEKALAFFLGN